MDLQPPVHSWRVQTSCNIPATSGTSVQGVRGFASAKDELVVRISHMGESITEGEIAVVMVKAGEEPTIFLETFLVLGKNYNISLCDRGILFFRVWLSLRGVR
eukprot:1446111-Pyramimonas_sp.AAC.1